jgi:uncharacterized Tic20 family protein
MSEKKNTTLSPEVVTVDESQPPADERRIAALAHGSILLNLLTVIGGPIVALVLWLMYSKKSKYIDWHALQALVFQGAVLIAMLVLGGISTILWVVAVPLLQVAVGFCLLPFALGFTLITVALLVGSLIYGCAGALAVLEGQDFRYRWIADLIPEAGQP